MLLRISLQLLLQIFNVQISQLLNMILQLSQFHRLQILLRHILDLQLLSFGPRIPMTVLRGTFLYQKLRIIRVLLIITSHNSYSHSRTTAGEKYGDSSDAVWSVYLTEAEKEDTKEIESWKGDTGGILVFVSLTPSCVHSLTETHLEDWSVLRHSRHLHHRELSELVAQLR